MEKVVSARVREVHASAKGVWTFIELTSSEGRLGSGEGTVHLGQERIAGVLGALANELVGKPAVPASLSWPAFGSTDFVDISARSALDQALTDLAAQAKGVSIARHFAAAPRPRVEVYANLNRRTRDRSPESFAASAKKAADADFHAVKIAPLDDVKPAMNLAEARPLVDAAVARAGAVRDTLGPDRRLLVDCHWRLNPATAAYFLDAMTPLKPFWIECPYAEDADHYADIKAFRKAANGRGIYTAGCELLRAQEGFQPFIDGELYDVLMPDVKHAGGLGTMLKMAEVGAKRGIYLSPHNPTGPISHAHSVQLSAALPEFLILEMQFDETGLFRTIADGALPMPEAGIASVPEKPGLGLRLAKDEAIPAEARGPASAAP
ncbi:MAG: hypothetical protein H6923_07810 [Alphaproteobacteria bacterium]|nr:hypothetical protein [Alphaproteobacteria bacterium]